MDNKDFTLAMLGRTKMYALNVLQLCNKVPDTTINRPLVYQLVKAGTSVGANYRATRRAKSKPDFLNKFKIVEEELDESIFFLEIIKMQCPEFEKEVDVLMAEGEELLKIIVASINKIRL